MKFSKILCVILVSFFTVLSASKPIYVNAEEISPTAWPGSPGGMVMDQKNGCKAVMGKLTAHGNLYIHLVIPIIPDL